MLIKLLILMLMFTLAGCATHAATSGRVVVRDDRVPAAGGFQERDRAIVTEYYRQAKRIKAPRGLAKREQLPPGMAKREVLPSSLHGQPLPADLEARMTVLPGSYVRMLVGRDMVLIQRNTREILDILYGVTD